MSALDRLLKFLAGSPYPPEAADPVDEHASTYERSTWFTGEETQALIATGDGPAIVAGEDLVISQLIGAIYTASDWYRNGHHHLGGTPELVGRWTPGGWVNDRRVP